MPCHLLIFAYSKELGLFSVQGYFKLIHQIFVSSSDPELSVAGTTVYQAHRLLLVTMNRLTLLDVVFRVTTAQKRRRLYDENQQD